MQFPPYLQSGDSILILSTARKISAEELQPSIAIFKKWGLNVLLGDYIFEEYNQFCGTDEQRISDLQNALNNPSIKAIICARGGYGTVRIIDKIDFTLFQKNPKWVCGFSDVTVLHNAIHNLGIASVHSTMPVLFSREEQKEAIESLRKTLFGETIEYKFSTHPKNKDSQMDGILIGGNLSIVNSLIGTATDIDTTGKILFLEDLDEYLYHIDRMMLHLKRAGLLTNLAGLIIGHMSDMNDNIIPFGKSAIEIIEDTVKEYNYPVVYGFPAGHENQNLAIKLGANICVSTNKNTSLFEYID